MNRKFEKKKPRKIITYESFIYNFYSVQADSSTRVKPFPSISTNRWARVIAAVAAVRRFTWPGPEARKSLVSTLKCTETLNLYLKTLSWVLSGAN